MNPQICEYLAAHKKTNLVKFLDHCDYYFYALIMFREVTNAGISSCFPIITLIIHILL